MTAALRLDRRSRAALRRRAPKPPTGAMLVYRVALRRALEAQQKRLWAIIERSYEEPKADTVITYYDGPRAYDVDSLEIRLGDLALASPIEVDAPADQAKIERYRRLLWACYVADCAGGSAGAWHAAYARAGGPPCTIEDIMRTVRRAIEESGVHVSPLTSDTTFTATFGGSLGVITSEAQNEPKCSDSLTSPPIFRTDAPADGGASKLKGEHIALAPKTLDLAASRVAKHAVDETARLLGVQFKGGETKRVPGGISRASQGADKETIAAFRKRNLSLIKRLERQQVEELRGVLEEATEKGWPVKTLRARVMERFSVTKSHADLIARDQILKLNGELQQMRQTKAGITEYIWSTSNDERVRPEHAELDGERFSWDDPPESGANGEREHPGQGISCRCVAIPVVPWLEED